MGNIVHKVKIKKLQIDDKLVKSQMILDVMCQNLLKFWILCSLTFVYKK